MMVKQTGLKMILSPFQLIVPTTLLFGIISGCQLKTSETGQPPQITTSDTVTREHDSREASPWMQNCETDIAQIKEQLSTLESLKGPYTVDSVLTPLNDIEIRINDGASLASLMENVHPNEAIRDNANKCSALYADLATQLNLSRDLYKVVSGVESEDLPADTRRYLDLTLQTFKLSGVDRDHQTRDRIRELNDRITKLGQEFDKNILEDVRYIEVPAADLHGLPADFIDSKTVDESGNIQLSTRYVDTIPVYTYAHSDQVREMLRQQDRSRGYPQNEEVLKALLEARHELATLLGFANFADLITSDKMIGSADNALSFIERIHGMAEPVAEHDRQELLARLQQIDPDASTVQRWQVNYLEEQIRREQYNIDATELRRYFSYSKVQQGIFGLVEHLFDVDIRSWDTPTWHESVKAYEMYSEGRLVGRFYLDMHPREGKYQHAAAFSYKTGINGQQQPVSALVCNFSGGDDPGAPMEYRQVRTFLHEFGHLLHSLFGGHQRWARLSGIATERDFVEAPSQMLEEWMYDVETLQSFAKNNAGEPIPAKLVESLDAARHFGEGSATSVQMYYAALSLEYHRLDPSTFNLTDKMLELEAEYSPYPHQQQTYFYANLGHLNGYSAIYYTYMWSNVIAKDMFSKFKQAGLRDRATARAYRDAILVPGGSKPASELVADFLERPYSFQAFSTNLRQGLPKED